MTTRRSPRRGAGTARDYPRTARLNQLLREIVADELERLDDERVPLLTVTAVEVEPDMRRAVVFYDCLDGEAGDEEALAVLGDARRQLQSAIAREARTKRTPELSFVPDPAVRSGQRIEAILRELPSEPGERGEPGGPGEPAAPTAPAAPAGDTGPAPAP